MREMILELTRYRGLLGMLAWRDIRVRYKQSLLGVSWAFLMPLIQTAVLYAIFTFGPMNFGDSIDGMPYLLFVLIGVVGWTFFNGGLAGSIESLTRNSRLVTKIYFPREVFPLASVSGSLVDFALAGLIVIPFYIFFAMRPDGPVPTTMLLLLPMVLAIQFLFVAGLALALSMLNLFFRDVKYIMTFVLQLWFFATNVVYPIRFETRPALQWIASANPMIPILDAYRNILMGQPLANPHGLVVAAIISMGVFLIGWTAFHKAEFKFAEYI